MLRRILVLTRHTPLPWEDGAGAYLFDILRYLHGEGFTVHVGWLAPHDHLRWQGLWTLPPEFAAIVRLHAPGALRLGRRRLLFPGIYWLPFIARAQDFVKRALALAGIQVVRRGRAPAGSTAGQPRSPRPGPRPAATGWMAVPSPAEHAFAARLLARLRPSTVVANYAWMAPLFTDSPAGLLPHRVCLHHDVAWRRAALQASLGHDNPEITRDEEAELLRKAATIIAISPADAEELRTLAPDADVLLAPKSVLPRPAAEPVAGQPRLLFVGSSNSFNTAGLDWFLREVWPLVRTAVPDADFDVCGSVASSVRARPAGTHFHGAVADLSPFYRDAALVVVPLHHATGLNIKLVEAAARGRAIVATTATLAGAPFLQPAVATADSPSDFARTVVGLLRDRSARERLAALGLAAVREHLAPKVCYAPLAAALA